MYFLSSDLDSLGRRCVRSRIIILEQEEDKETTRKDKTYMYVCMYVCMYVYNQQ